MERMYHFMIRCIRFAKRKAKGLLRRIKKFLKINSTIIIPDLYKIVLECMTEGIQTVTSEEIVDVIVPIYNGYDYLIKLFPTLNRTNLKCNIFLVDDCSTDSRVQELEKVFADKNDNVVLLQNEQNYGFVKSVNKALMNTKNHVALVNTDTELPNLWLERLMAPIFQNEKVATSTPFTNSATIYSFPDFCYNNAIYRGMSVDEIDRVFSKIKPRYVKAPTGVGFCMGMNKKAIAEIGGLDYETFSKGFGEENDWCQRAVRKGYSNVQVENLFVYHKHGGSFTSEEKEALIKNNVAIVNKRYPNYGNDVAAFIQKDVNKDIRQLAQMLLDMSMLGSKSKLYFDHNLGGGATAYLENQIKTELKDGNACSVIRFRYSERDFLYEYYCGDTHWTYIFKTLEQFLEIQKWFHFDEVYVNELVTYHSIATTLNNIKELAEKQRAKLVFLFHDYFAVCPTINLVGPDEIYCQFPDEERCGTCFRNHQCDQTFGCMNVSEWRKIWKPFLLECDEVRCFSEDTFEKVQMIFGEELRLTMIPHKVEYLFPLQKKYKITDTINIGVLGVLSKNKGANVVREMLSILEAENKDEVRVKLIGKAEDESLKAFSFFSETGKYTQGELPRLLLENDIDMVFIPSIWPETFSYTTEEAMQLGIPVACFDLGAPAKRVAKYGKGIVIPKIDSTLALDSVVSYVKANRLPTVEDASSKKIVYITEYTSFSSRYRLEHLREELLFAGIPGEIWSMDQFPKAYNMDCIRAIVIYRCRDVDPLKAFVEEALMKQIPIYYSIDDLVYDYEEIKELGFFDPKVYHNLKQYTQSVVSLIEKSEGIISSTDTLTKCLKSSFPDKKVIIDRNVASMEMWVLSNIARMQKKDNGSKVVLGYFSGSKTHNNDFELISDELYELMKNNENVELLIVGVLDINKSFERFENRIKRVGFVDWKQLPFLLATIDINLMPLENTKFHRCKSENKWMEAAMVEVPTIGSYNEEIGAHTSNGEDIILCHTSAQWNDGLTRLVQDKNERARIARNALDRVKREKTTCSGHEDVLKMFLEER